VGVVQVGLTNGKRKAPESEGTSSEDEDSSEEEAPPAKKSKKQGKELWQLSEGASGTSSCPSCREQ